jgi:hypothetical protein
VVEAARRLDHEAPLPRWAKLAVAITLLAGYELANYVQQRIEADQSTMMEWVRSVTILITYLTARVLFPQFF